MTDEIYADINDALPPHTRLSSKLTINEGPIPITAMVGGRKMKVGEGVLDPETGMFEGTFDSDNVAADIVRERISASNSVASTSFSIQQVKRLSVDEVHLSIRQVITKEDLLSVSLVAEEPNPDYGVHPIDTNEEFYYPIGVSQDYIDKSLLKEAKEFEAKLRDEPTPKSMTTTRSWGVSRFWTWWMSSSAAQKPARRALSTYSRLEQIWTESA